MMTILSTLATALPDMPVLVGDDMAPWITDWTGAWSATPRAVARPANTAEVATTLRLAHAAGVPVVPAGGLTGVTGGTHAPNALVLSLDRMTTIRDISPTARYVTAEAGVILQTLRDAADAQDMVFPMTFGAQGSATIGGILATNAGGSNVLRYGNTRDLCLGIEAVMADGTVIDLMGALHKDNAGYALKHLLIGSEGTLAVITAATLKLVPRPLVRSTGFLAAASLDAALVALNRLQQASAGAVEAYEYMPANYMAAYRTAHPDTRMPFDQPHAVNLLVELASTAPPDAAPGDGGQPMLAQTFETALAALFDEGLITDAVLAQNDAQRAAFWAIREAAAELSLSGPRPAVINDIAVPLDSVAVFLDRMADLLPSIDPSATTMVVAHLGDGNIHYTVRPSDPVHKDQIMQTVETEVHALGGSFSAEHGVGQAKLASMARHKDPGALAAMRALKTALDPSNILNPGKVLP